LAAFGQQQNRDSVPGSAKLAANVKSADPREFCVENQKMKAAPNRFRQAFQTVSRGLDAVAALLQAVPHAEAQIFVVMGL
jgi:hypothetical protein